MPSITSGAQITNASQLANGIITEDKLASDAVTTNKVKNSQVTAGKLAGSITPALLTKGIVQFATAQGTSDITTTSASFVDMTDMGVTITTGANTVLALFTAPMSASTNSTFQIIQLIEDAASKMIMTDTAIWSSVDYPCSTVLTALFTTTAASHTYKIQWKTSGGTYRQSGATYGPRNLTIFELK